ncbi:ABC transporter substrate-binding protein [Lysinibacillus sp. NPDC047702]|uniref:ABC transporter substrate-binding protein n=1 Tax=unclassified Lysinibacillus TaxID=2636778 RepID=UPI003CFF7606
MNWNEQIKLWNMATVRILDIRHHVICDGQDLCNYKLPTNVFLFVANGNAFVRIDEHKCYVKRHHLVHAGKGTKMDILPARNEFSYYIIYFKVSNSDVTVSPFAKHSTNQLLEPLHLFYHVVLQEPGVLYNHIRGLYEEWGKCDELSKIRSKSLFYEFIYELFNLLQNSTDKGKPSKLIAYALNYIHKNYHEVITMRKLADLLGCSVSYMHRLFKAEVGESPNDYIIGIRLEQASQLLLTTQLSVGEIAFSIGYSDMYYFSRLFKKQFGVSPLHFRERRFGHQGLHLNPSKSSLFSIVPVSSLSYNEGAKEIENLSQSEGEIQLLITNRTKTTLASLILVCVSILISGCQADNGKPSSENDRNNSITAVNNKGEEASRTKIYKHIDGETEIPLEPKRVFTDVKVGQLMALGVQPVGSSSYPLQTGFIAENDIEDVGIFPLNLEKVASLEPDLIILTEAWRDGGGYEAFSKIAPTVIIPNHSENLADELRMFGEILGKEKESEEWLSKFEEKVAAAKEKVDAIISKDETFTILNVRQDAFLIYDDVNMGGNIIYKYLGLTPQEKVQAEVLNGEVWEISAEVIPEYIGDHLFIATNKDGEDSLKENEQIWASTAAVQNGKVYHINFDQFLLNDPISVLHQLDMITELILENNR